MPERHCFMLFEVRMGTVLTILTCRVNSNSDTVLLCLYLAESHWCIMIMRLLIMVVM